MEESFYDWEQGLKKKKEQIKNPLGISAREFKSYMKKWREKNLKHIGGVDRD